MSIRFLCFFGMAVFSLLGICGFSLYAFWVMAMLRSDTGTDFGSLGFLVGPALVILISCFYGMCGNLLKVIDKNSDEFEREMDIDENKSELLIIDLLFISFIFYLMVVAVEFGSFWGVVCLTVPLIPLVDSVIKFCWNFCITKFCLERKNN